MRPSPISESPGDQADFAEPAGTSMPFWPGRESARNRLAEEPMTRTIHVTPVSDVSSPPTLLKSCAAAPPAHASSA